MTVTSIRRTIVASAAALTLAVTAAPAQAAFPGDPGPIVFTRENNSFEDRGGLFTHGPKQADSPAQLTKDTRDHDPSFSPDGRWVVFAGDRDGDNVSESHIYTVFRNGSGAKQVTDGGWDSNPAFSPDGQRIVFDRKDGDARHLFSVRREGSGLRQLTDGRFSDTDPTYAPTGRRIAFVSDRHRQSNNRTGIFTIRPNGTGLRVLIDRGAKDDDPDYSPSGRLIAFASGPNIYVARANGTRARALTHSRRGCFSGACYLGPAFAPDGKHIAYLTRGRFNSDIEVIRTDGRNEKQFVEGGWDSDGIGIYVGPPSWGPRPK